MQIPRVNSSIQENVKEIRVSDVCQMALKSVSTNPCGFMECPGATKSRHNHSDETQCFSGWLARPEKYSNPDLINKTKIHEKVSPRGSPINQKS